MPSTNRDELVAPASAINDELNASDQQTLEHDVPRQSQALIVHPILRRTHGRDLPDHRQEDDLPDTEQATVGAERLRSYVDSIPHGMIVHQFGHNGLAVFSKTLADCTIHGASHSRFVTNSTIHGPSHSRAVAKSTIYGDVHASHGCSITSSTIRGNIYAKHNCNISASDVFGNVHARSACNIYGDPDYESQTTEGIHSDPQNHDLLDVSPIYHIRGDVYTELANITGCTLRGNVFTTDFHAISDGTKSKHAAAQAVLDRPKDQDLTDHEPPYSLHGNLHAKVTKLVRSDVRGSVHTEVFTVHGDVSFKPLTVSATHNNDQKEHASHNLRGHVYTTVANITASVVYGNVHAEVGNITGSVIYGDVYTTQGNIAGGVSLFGGLYGTVLNQIIQTDTVTLQHSSNDELRHNATNQSLLKSAAEGLTERLSHLIQERASTDYTDGEGWTALHHACFAGHEDTVEILLSKHVDVLATSKSCGTPLCLAALKGHDAIVSRLLEIVKPLSSFASGGLGSPLHAACMAGNLKSVKSLVKHWPQSLEAVAKVDTRMAQELRSGRPRTMSESTTYLECRPVHIAALSGHLEVVRILFGNGADVNSTYGSGKTLLIAAASSGSGRLVEFLLEGNADVNAESQEGDTPLLTAVNAKTDSCVLALMKAKPRVDHLNCLSHTPLIQAVHAGDPSIMEILLNNNAQLDIRGREGWTALHVAAQRGRLECLGLLLSHNARFDIADDTGRRALSHAAERGHVECVKKLLSKDTSYLCRDSQGYDAVRYAVEAGSTEVIEAMFEITGQPFADIMYEDRKSLMMIALATRKPGVAECLANHLSARLIASTNAGPEYELYDDDADDGVPSQISNNDTEKHAFAKFADGYMDNVTNKVHPVLPPPDTRERAVRVAVIDTGVAFPDSVHDMDYDGRMRECRTWFDASTAGGLPQEYGADEDGHGTHLTSLVLDVAPHCDVYVAGVFRGRKSVRSAVAAEQGLHTCIANAIRYAVDEWQADIISMSWGFDGPIPKIKEALRYAVSKDKLLLAAASNCGGNSTPSWPATDPSVMAINASDGIGNKYARSPTPQPRSDNFSTLGVAVHGWARRDGAREAHRVRRSGTSSATAVAAGIAALIIDIARCRKLDYLGETPSLQDELSYQLKLLDLGTIRGMPTVFRLMTTGEQKRDAYDYVAPWALLQKHKQPGDLVAKILDVMP